MEELGLILKIPHGVAAQKPSTIDELATWEQQLLGAFSESWEQFTEFRDYFRTRTLEFRAIRQLLPGIFDLANPNGLTVELGCGFGYTSLLLAPFSQRIVGVDIPADYPSHTMARFANPVEAARDLVNNTLGRDDIEFKAAWPADLPLDDACADLVFTQYVLEHIPDLPTAVAEMWRVTRPGGTNVHVIPNVAEYSLRSLEANGQVPLVALLKAAVAKVLFREHSGPRLSLNLTVVPPLHSEFARDARHQVDIYRLESFIFPMLEAGFELVSVNQTREHSRVLTLRRPVVV